LAGFFGLYFYLSELGEIVRQEKGREQGSGNKDQANEGNVTNGALEWATDPFNAPV